MVHNRKNAEEPATNISNLFGKLEVYNEHCPIKEGLGKCTSRNTKKGAIKKACTRLSRRAGARFCQKYAYGKKQYVC